MYNKLANTYNSNCTIWLQQCVQALQKFERKEADWLGAAGEDVVDDIVEACAVLVVSQLLSIATRIGQHGQVILLQIKVPLRKCMNHGVQFHNRCINTVRDERRRSRSNT